MDISFCKREEYSIKFRSLLFKKLALCFKNDHWEQEASELLYPHIPMATGMDDYRDTEAGPLEIKWMSCKGRFH